MQQAWGWRGDSGLWGHEGKAWGVLPLLKLCDAVPTVELGTWVFQSPSRPFLPPPPLPGVGAEPSADWGTKARWGGV